MIVPEPVPGKEIAVNRFDHEKLDVYQAAVDSVVATHRDADPDGASCRGLAATLAATKAGAVNFFAMDLSANLRGALIRARARSKRQNT